ncbi:MAG: type II secretion system F family protein, partial [Fimbriimonadaceae bacterium]|nr:type II secretion system F family protein [Fimbriimonadaceae bacterium]
LHFFFRQVGTMLHAGVGLAQSLATIATQTSHPKLRRIVEEASQSVVAGRPMTSCFRRYPEVFTDLMMCMIQIGEDGGMLPEQCRRLADYIQRDMEQRNLIRRETAYPKIVLAASIVIILAANALIAMIAPSAPGLSSPLTNPRVWMVLGPLLILGFLAWRYGRHNPEVRRVVQGIGVSLPGLGGTIRGFAMAKFGRALGALYAAGVPIPRALELSADACGNEHVRSRMYPAASALKDGVPLSLALAQTGSVSPLVLEMIRTGEMTGNIDEMLTKTAEYYEDEGALRAKQFATIFGVVVFLAVAVYIASIIIGFYTGHFRSLMSGV